MVTRPARPAPHTLMPLVTDLARLKRAARELMRRGGSSGADGITWAQYRDGLDERIAALSGRLRDGTWSPGSVRALTIPSWGKTLPLAIPPAEDRIVHRAVRLAAEPVLELTGASLILGNVYGPARPAPVEAGLSASSSPPRRTSARPRCTGTAGPRETSCTSATSPTLC